MTQQNYQVPKVSQRLHDKPESSHMNAYASAEKSSLKRKRPSIDDHKKMNVEMKKSRPQRGLKEKSSRHKERRCYIEAGLLIFIGINKINKNLALVDVDQLAFWHFPYFYNASCWFNTHLE